MEIDDVRKEFIFEHIFWLYLKTWVYNAHIILIEIGIYFTHNWEFQNKEIFIDSSYLPCK